VKKLLVALLFIMLLILSACGGGGGPSTTINVTMTDFMFTPDSFMVLAGKEITLNATNNGAVEHDFVILKLGANVGDKFDSEDAPNVFLQAKVSPGESKSITFTAPAEAGDYYVTCGIPGHHEAGMNGKLTVVVGE
jgi:uncharacterized cupredoxin-like copper-binding protein